MSSPSSPEQGAAASGGGDPAAGGGACLVALGQRLRQAREARGLAPAVLADRLRIGVEQLEALESADRERLPEPVFVIAQVRRIAGALQLDVTADLQALRASGELMPRPWPGALQLPRAVPAAPIQFAGDVAAGLGPEASSDARPGLRRRPPLGRKLVLVSTLLLALAALWAAWRLAGPHRAPPNAPRPSPSAGPVSRPSRVAVAAGKLAPASRETTSLEEPRLDGAIRFQGLLRGSRLFSLGQGPAAIAARPVPVGSRIGAAPAGPLGPISEVRWRSLPAGH